MSPLAGYLAVAPEVRDALAARRPVVALETAVVSHGLPSPTSLETALAMEERVRTGGAIPATIAIDSGRAVVGASRELLERLARGGAAKASSRDLAPLLARAGGLGGTTVAATVEIAAEAAIAVVATGGIGGVHRGAETTLDVSADLAAIARHPVCVVCSGAKLVLDLAKTLEVLETYGVPVVGLGTDELPAFTVRTSGLRLAHRVDDAKQAGAVARVQLERGAGIVVAVPVPKDAALDRAEAERAVAEATARAEREHVGGAGLTPFLLAAMRQTTSGRAVAANVALLRNNAAVAAEIARELAG